MKSTVARDIERHRDVGGLRPLYKRGEKCQRRQRANADKARKTPQKSPKSKQPWTTTVLLSALSTSCTRGWARPAKNSTLLPPTQVRSESNDAWVTARQKMLSEGVVPCWRQCKQPCCRPCQQPNYAMQREKQNQAARLHDEPVSLCW